MFVNNEYIQRYQAMVLLYYWRIRRKLGHVIKRRGKVILPVEFEQKKIVFFHIPKAAGKSLATAVFGKDTNHFSYRQVAKQLDLDKFYTFAFVRNPWDRMVSTYNFLRKGGWGGLDQIWLQANGRHLHSFSDFLLFVQSHPRDMVHFLPQTHWVCDKNGNIKVDFIGKFENIQQDYKKLCDHLKITNPLPHMNASPRCKDYRSYYKNDGNIKIVQLLYEDDIRLFDYHY
ncbi:sulfotransferase family 2 domain-containing protein [Candidatus Uabimicrobium sp. HlEnr_7]|uniref:sulfotransferase family 2 domain-containing protein n=1 Tax=Candidatus Uabimicrobium helgolandensis TaxID=3095367 RepID=UPI003557987D